MLKVFDIQLNVLDQAEVINVIGLYISCTAATLKPPRKKKKASAPELIGHCLQSGMASGVASSSGAIKRYPAMGVFFCKCVKTRAYRSVRNRFIQAQMSWVRHTRTRYSLYGSKECFLVGVFFFLLAITLSHAFSLW